MRSDPKSVSETPAEQRRADREWEAMKMRSDEYKLVVKRKKDAEDDRVMQAYREYHGPLFLPTERYIHAIKTMDTDQRCHMCNWRGRPTRPQLCPDCGTRDVLSIATEDDRETVEPHHRAGLERDRHAEVDHGKSWDEIMNELSVAYTNLTLPTNKKEYYLPDVA